MIRKNQDFGNESIHRDEINNEQWQETSFIRTDRKQEFRERPQFGNRHVIFNTPQDEWGRVHYDEHNALDFPNGTTNHLAKYTKEKTGISENIAKLGIVVVGLIASAAVLKFLKDEFS